MKESARRALDLGNNGNDDPVCRRESPQPNGRSTVRFVESDQRLVSHLEVFAPAEWDVMVDVCRMLHELRVQVVTMMRDAHQGGSLQFRLYVVEFDGAMLDRRRHDEVVAALGATLEAIERLHVPPRSGVRACAPRRGDGPSAETADAIEEVA